MVPAAHDCRPDTVLEDLCEGRTSLQFRDGSVALPLAAAHCVPFVGEWTPRFFISSTSTTLSAAATC